MNGDILYKYKTIDHIINRANFDPFLNDFIQQCNSYNIKLFQKQNSEYIIFSHDHIKTQINNTKKNIIKQQLHCFDKLTEQNNISINEYNDIISLKQHVYKHLNSLNNIEMISKIIYKYEYFKTNTYSNKKCCEIYKTEKNIIEKFQSFP